MAELDESMIAVADVYARALFELATERDQEERVTEQLAELGAVMDRDPEFEVFVVSDAIDDESRGRSLEKMFRGRLVDTLVDTLLVMNAKGRLGLLRALGEQYAHVRHAGHQEVEAAVTTAVPLEKRERKTLIEELRRMTGREVILTEEVSPAVLGGLVVQIGDHRIDASLASRLKALREQLRARASAEIHGGKEYVIETAKPG